jgi:hypothetical protein
MSPFIMLCDLLAAHALKWNTQLMELGLADNFLEAKAISELATALEHNSVLQILNLSGEYGKPSGMPDTSITRAAPRPSLRLVGVGTLPHTVGVRTVEMF